MNAITRVNTLKTSEEFREYLKKVDAIIPFDEELSPGNVSPLGKPFLAGSKTVGNRFPSCPWKAGMRKRMAGQTILFADAGAGSA
jgi:hypothetical protein